MLNGPVPPLMVSVPLKPGWFTVHCVLVGMEMLGAGLTTTLYALLSVLPLPSVTLTVKVAVPASVGVAVRLTVPLVPLTVKSAALKSVVPGLKPVTVMLLYGVTPPATVSV